MLIIFHPNLFCIRSPYQKSSLLEDPLHYPPTSLPTLSLFSTFSTSTWIKIRKYITRLYKLLRGCSLLLVQPLILIPSYFWFCFCFLVWIFFLDISLLPQLSNNGVLVMILIFSLLDTIMMIYCAIIPFQLNALSSLAPTQKRRIYPLKTRKTPCRNQTLSWSIFQIR